MINLYVIRYVNLEVRTLPNVIFSSTPFGLKLSLVQQERNVSVVPTFTKIFRFRYYDEMSLFSVNWYLLILLNLCEENVKRIPSLLYV